MESMIQTSFYIIQNHQRRLLQTHKTKNYKHKRVFGEHIWQMSLLQTHYVSQTLGETVREGLNEYF